MAFSRWDHAPWEERFWAKVDRSGDCWIWTGARTQKGYGLFNGADGRMHGVHRISYELAHGPIGDDLTVDHLCEVTCCVNPDHLQLLTRSENAARTHRCSRRTECIHGHPLAGENLYVTPDGRRQCRACARERTKKVRV